MPIFGTQEVGVISARKSGICNGGSSRRTATSSRSQYVTPGSPSASAVGLPAAGGEEIFLLHLANIEAGHGFTQFLAGFEHRFGILKVRGGLNHGFGTRFRIAGFENPGADENCSRAKTAKQGSVCRCGNAAGREIGHR